MEAPKRRVTLKIEIGGDDWCAVSEALESIAFRIDSEGPITTLVSGGWSNGYSVIGSEDSRQTGDKYREALGEYVEGLKLQNTV